MFIGAHNKCRWLRYRTTLMCDKNCVGEYCATHNREIKNGMMTFPCRKCGIGISHNGVCVKCFGYNLYQRTLNKKRRDFSAVMTEIKDKVKLVE